MANAAMDAASHAAWTLWRVLGQQGHVLREIVEVSTGDFRDLRLWRRQFANLAVGLVEEYRRPVLVPMTLVNPG
ncbi:hypothetical protein ACFWD7_53770 [Streptomyces mirabilis]|uniref:hypothetical protein n=1 Tax=Streptomyces mirabilis TaxID=68239 RepID=UPI0036B8E6CD